MEKPRNFVVGNSPTALVIGSLVVLSVRSATRDAN